MQMDDEHFRKLERLYHGAPINRYFQPTLRLSNGTAELHMSSRLVMAGCVAAALAIAGCTSDAADDGAATRSSLHFDTAAVRIITKTDTIRLAVELADSREQKSTGLMERRQLADSAGMLFVYDSLQPPEAGFWMYRTRIPLDIAYMNPAGRIRAIQLMVPCESAIPQGCPTYPPGLPYQYALEVNGGFFARRGVAVGDSIFLGAALRRLK
jgi:uncharacterized membrane protein (UPF0127 family)